MRTFHHSFVVATPIDKVWDFYTDLHHLEIITPKRLDLQIIESSSDRISLGQTASFSSRLLTRVTWNTTITICKPYTYADEMSNHALFKHWRHTHAFHKINEDQTKIDDEIEFELRYGFVGKMFEWYALYKLKKIFAHRQQKTIETLNKSETS
ncbi:MAG: SRPBCC family protein [Nitrosopumilus sp.]